MKPLRQVERSRHEYRVDAQRNTVHRSSLLAPHLPGTDVDLSFVNHFLLKRGYRHVACRLTAVDPSGKRIESRTFPVSEARVYAVELGPLTAGPVGTYLVEFFSPSNLFIPFPAAVVNHRGPAFLNSVHSYNRVLNDVFEDDEINAIAVREVSIDVRIDGTTDTFALFTAGPVPCRGTIGVRLTTAEGVLASDVPIDVPRLGHHVLSLRALFGDRVPPSGGILTLQQPAQLLFYGRMLAGRRCTTDGALSANHSFYDCSEIEEYWDDDHPSSRVYPLFEEFLTSVRLYPIFSPCRLLAGIDFFDRTGRRLKSLECEPLASPSTAHLECRVSEAAAREGVEEAVSFRFRVRPERGRAPRRINHQLVYRGGGPVGSLEASIAVSLRHPGGFAGGERRGLTWGQCAVGAGLESRLGIVVDEPDGRPAHVRVGLIGEQGPVSEIETELPGGAAWVVDPAALAPELARAPSARPHYLWYWATSERPDLSAYTITRHRRSGHCTGDHGF